MAMFIFGLMGVASLFSALSFAPLAWRRARFGNVWRDGYFWLSLGITLLCIGLLVFAITRTIQAATTGPIPFVLDITAALSATAVICAGLACFVRAKALTHPHLGRLFLLSLLAWAGFCALYWKAFV